MKHSECSIIEHIEGTSKCPKAMSQNLFIGTRKTLRKDSCLQANTLVCGNPHLANQHGAMRHQPPLGPAWLTRSVKETGIQSARSQWKPFEHKITSLQWRTWGASKPSTTSQLPECSPDCCQVKTADQQQLPSASQSWVCSLNVISMSRPATARDRPTQCSSLQLCRLI
jgi:hypothetical protein